MLERQRQAAHDGEAETETVPAVLARFASLELLKDRVAPLLRDAGPGVPHFDDPAAAPRPSADQHPAAPRIAQGVGDQVLDDPSQEQRIGRHHPPRAEMPELQSPLGRALRLLPDQRGDERVDRKGLEVRRHHAGVELGEVEQRAQEVLERRQAPVRLIDEIPRRAAQVEADSADSASRAAFSGWRRSWLIEVRTEDLRRLAASACCFALMRSSFAFSIERRACCTSSVRRRT